MREKLWTVNIVLNEGCVTKKLIFNERVNERWNNSETKAQFFQEMENR